MGFFSEIVRDCTADKRSAKGVFARSEVKNPVESGYDNRREIVIDDNGAQDSTKPFPLADSNTISNNHIPQFSNQRPVSNQRLVSNQRPEATPSHSLMHHDEKLSGDESQNITSHEEMEEFNFADEHSIEDDLEIDLAAQLHRVQVERSLKTRSRVRDNVPCSEESQMINPKGGDSDEHSYEINVNKSSIVRKQMTSAENDRDYMSDSEFFESSSDGRACDKNLHNRYDSDKSFYDQKVELTKSQINQRESRSRTEVEGINLRNSQGQRTQPERLENGPESYTRGPKRLEKSSERLANKNANISKVNISNDRGEAEKSIDMTSIFSELESAVSVLSSDSHSNKLNKPNQSKNRYKPSSLKAKSETEAQIEDLFELNGKNQLGSGRSRDVNNRRNENIGAQKQKNKSQGENRSSKNRAYERNASSANPLQPKITIGQIDIIVNAAPEAKVEPIGAGILASPFLSASSGQSSSNNNSSFSSKNYTRRI